MNAKVTNTAGRLFLTAGPSASPCCGLAIGTLLVFSINAQCCAAPVAVNNPSFESPDTLDGTKSSTLTGWSIFNGGMQFSVFDPDNTSYPNASGNSVSLPGTATGYQVGFVTGGGARISQYVGALLLNRGSSSGCNSAST